MVLTSVGQNKQIERNTTFGLIFFFFSSVYDCIWNKSAELSFAVVSVCLIVEQCPVSLQAVATMEIRNTSSFSSSNPVFFCGEWGYMVWNISLASSGQGLQLCSLPTSCSVLGCARWKDGSRWAPMKKVNSILARPSTPSLCGFLGKIQQISCFLYSSYWAWRYMS